MEWITKYPDRFVGECAQLDKLAKEVDWLTVTWSIAPESLNLEVQLDIRVHDRVYEASMGYPSVFPNAPLYIRPRDKLERWSSHQYGPGGSLCLEWRADNWNSEITGADVIRSAYQLLHTENIPVTPGVVTSVHRVTEGQSARSTYYRSVLTNDALTVINGLQDQIKIEFKVNSILSVAGQVAFITNIKVEEDKGHDFEDVPIGITGSSSLFSVKEKGWLFKSNNFDSPLTITSVDELIKTISDAGLDISDVAVKSEETNKYEKRAIVLYGSKTGAIRQFSIVPYSENPLKEYKVILPPKPDDVRLPEEHIKLAELKVGIIGLGSMGSKIALSLARSKVQKFVLVDDDFLKLENLVRHELTWAEVGLHKVEAIQNALNLTMPNIEVQTFSHRIAGQESPINSAKVLQSLSQCDLLIDATANPEVFLHIAAIANAYKIPMCWGEVFAGGYGGFIARARPDIDPNPTSIRDGFYEFLSKQEPAPFQQELGYDIESETPSIAYDSNVGMIATSLTNLIIDTALQKNPSEYPVPIYLIGMKKMWIFTQPFHIWPIEVSGQGWDNEVPPTKEASTEAIKLLLEKLSEKRSAEIKPLA